MSYFALNTVSITVTNQKLITKTFEFVIPRVADFDIDDFRRLCQQRSFVCVQNRPDMIVDKEPWLALCAFLNWSSANLIDSIRQALLVVHARGNDQYSWFNDLAKVILRRESPALGSRFQFWSDFRIVYKDGYTFKGTPASINAEQQQTRKQRQIDHLERYLKLFYLGQANSPFPILCAFSETPIVTIDQYTREIDIDLDLHHTLNYLGTSCYKHPSYEPSSFLRDARISDEKLFELMTTIPLTGRPHTKVHTILTNGHDIDFFKRLWKLWPTDKRPPSFVFESEENYNFVVDWLEQNDRRPHFRANFPYSKFLKHITYRNEYERDICERDIDKFFDKVARNTGKRV